MQAKFNLHSMLHGDHAQLAQLFQAAAAPAPAAALRTNSAEKVCAFLLKAEQFDPVLAPLLSELQTGLAAQVAQDDSFYCDPQHPLRKAMAIILTRGRSWYARDSRASQQFLEKLSTLMQCCGSTDHLQRSRVVEDVEQWIASEDKRAAMLETRLCETEINHLKALNSEAGVVNVINAALVKHSFPQVLIAGVSATMKSELLHAYVIAGSDNPFWKVWQRLLPLLGRTFSVIASAARNEADEQMLYRTVPALLNELEHSLTLHTSNPDTYRHWIELVCEQLMLAIKKQPIACEQFAPLSLPEGYSDLTSKARVTTDLLQQSHDLQVGDWILFSGEQGQLIRCKLALKNSDLDQLLFVDNTGRKVMNKSSGDFAVCLATGIAKKMVPLQTEDALAKILQALMDLQQQKQTHLSAQSHVENAKAQATETTEAMARQAEAARKQAADTEEKQRVVHALSIRRAAAQKALAEAGALAKERALRAAEITLNQERARMQAEAAQAAENLQRIQLANINISALNLGARVELVRDGVTLNCKLAVIIAASGKYIFVDNLGRKVAELQREQLVQALLDQQLTLLNKGNNFDDQLAKVIRGLRKDIS